MTNYITRSIENPIRKNLSWDQRWQADDRGLIACWERGREKRNEDPNLAEFAQKGELPILCWKGGVEKAIKKKEKFGHLNYLAMWQGLRGEDLDIHTDEELVLQCTRSSMKVCFTSDLTKLLNS